MIEQFYKLVWSTLGKRPWTFISRDIWHQYEYVAQALWFWIGVAVFHFLGILGVGVFWAIYTFGYINGHFFWGTRYRPNQRD